MQVGRWNGSFWFLPALKKQQQLYTTVYKHNISGLEVTVVGTNKTELN